MKKSVSVLCETLGVSPSRLVCVEEAAAKKSSIAEQMRGWLIRFKKSSTRVGRCTGVLAFMPNCRRRRMTSSRKRVARPMRERG